MLVGIALLMTVGVYGLVAGIVKLDDGALALARTKSKALQALGRGILVATPWLMKSLSVAGTAAMFLVGGGILAHGIPALHHVIEGLAHGLPRPASGLVTMLLNALVGLVAGLVVVAVVGLVRARSRTGHARLASFDIVTGASPCARTSPRWFRELGPDPDADCSQPDGP